VTTPPLALAGPPGRLARLWTWLLPEGTAGLAAAPAAADPAAGRRLAWQAAGALLLAAVCLALLKYLGSSDRTPEFWQAALLRVQTWLTQTTVFSGLGGRLAELGDKRLIGLSWWSFSCFVFYLVIPSLYVRGVIRGRLRDYGLETAGFLRHLPLYGVLFLLVLPFVVGASFDAAFQAKYPFYARAGRSALHFFAWELLYALQFFSLEFFFRGFLLQTLRPAMGLLAIPVMVVPYCMIHFGKPLAEALAAIVAGCILGLLALATRSIWCGALIHTSVAVTMDLLSLGHRGKLGNLFGG